MLATQEAQVMPLIVTKHFSYSPASSTVLLKATVLLLMSRSLAERTRVLERPEWLAISWLLLSPSATHGQMIVYSADHRLYWLSHILSYGASLWETAGLPSPGSSSAHLQQMVQTTRTAYSADHSLGWLLHLGLVCGKWVTLIRSLIFPSKAGSSSAAFVSLCFSLFLFLCGFLFFFFLFFFFFSFLLCCC